MNIDVDNQPWYTRLALAAWDRIQGFLGLRRARPNSDPNTPAQLSWENFRIARSVHKLLYRAHGYQTTSGRKEPKAGWEHVGEALTKVVDGCSIQARYLAGSVNKEHSGEVLFFNGGSENLFDVTNPQKYVDLMQQGYSILIYNPLGYGRSEGKRTPQGDIAVGRALMEHLTIDKQVDPAQITVIGSSIGSGVATWIASEYAVKHLVLEAPFAKLENVLPRVASNQWLGSIWKPLVSYLTTKAVETHFHHDNLVWIENTQAQAVSIIEGKSDAIMYMGGRSEGEKLFEASGCNDNLWIKIRSTGRGNGTHGDRQLYDPTEIVHHIEAIQQFRDERSDQSTNTEGEVPGEIGNLADQLQAATVSVRARRHTRYFTWIYRRATSIPRVLYRAARTD